jgi:methyltransferase (TIGR00027 family)
MREDTPSLTAVYVAFARALATRDRELSRACSDPCAEKLLPRALLPLLQRASASPTVRATLRRISLGMTDHIAMRTGLIDSAVDHATGHSSSHGGSAALARPGARAEAGSRAAEPRASSQAGAHGIEQVVLLGAGLDARAHRLPSLANAVVFEVDHPATQKLKRKKAAALPRTAREVRYAACDFQDTHLSLALTNSGFNPRERSLWIWEGVTMYLPAAAVVDTLATIERHSAPDSVLVATYITPELVVGGSRLGHLSTLMLGVISEPIRFTRTPEDIEALLAHASFEVLSDALPVDAAAHYGVHVTRPTSLMPKERIVVAIKRGNQT